MKKLLVILACVVGCSGPASPGAANDPAPGSVAPPPSSSPSASADAPEGAPPTAPPTTSCTGKDPLAGDLAWTVLGRKVLVHVPPSYDPTRPLPVVLNFHGYTNDAAYQARYSGMPAKADAVGFVAVHPQGTGSLASWNAGACCGEATDQDVDDVAFTRAILDELAARLCIDPHRVFATGFSNGGFFAHRLACELSDRIAAVAPVSGVLGIPSCSPKRAVPVMDFHGTGDSIVPYEGDPSWGFASVASTVDGWATRDGCSDAPRTTYANGDVTCTTRDACAGGAEVTLCTVKDGGHTWPGAVHEPGGGATTQDIRATDAMWTFFERHPLP